MGFPFEHGLHATLMAMRLAELLEVDRDTVAMTYFTSLLMYSGCTSDADVSMRLFGGSQTEHVTPVHFDRRLRRIGGVVRALPSPEAPPLRRAAQIAVRLPRAARQAGPHFAAFCEVAEMLAERLGLPATVQGLMRLLTERWDGGGPLRRAEGDELPLALRIAQVARDVAFQRLVHGDEGAVQVVRDRSGHAFDPKVVGAFVAAWRDVFAAADVASSAWEATLDAEPAPWRHLDGGGIDRALAAMGMLADLTSPFQSGHSSGVAALAEAAARQCGLDDVEVVRVRRAALVHDVGRAATHPAVWQKRGPLGADEWEQVRLHAYHTERVLARAPSLAPLADLARSHHERLDGSGYHRALPAASLPRAARLLAVADAFHAMTEPRPHRAALTARQAGAILAADADAGRHDPDAVAAVLAAAGQPVPPIARPSQLTVRETQVVGLVARGLLTKQVAKELGISVKTADRHLQHAYRRWASRPVPAPPCSPSSTGWCHGEISRYPSAGDARSVADVTASPAGASAISWRHRGQGGEPWRRNPDTPMTCTPSTDAWTGPP
ncbi:HD domain-containing phosphohydrolase [Egicoccus sp. AB-alg6-2]|uniref:HD domain-containing phosphohydrolase n=1 Tax=Egicoccus sp. AB-alg6-2 TaxID=3242692 RepID=UPI00359E8210